MPSDVQLVPVIFIEMQPLHEFTEATWAPWERFAGLLILSQAALYMLLGDVEGIPTLTTLRPHSSRKVVYSRNCS